MLPRGDFEHLEIAIGSGQYQLVTRAWYAPAVGMVKWEGREGRLKVLKRFIRGMSGVVEPPLQPLPAVERR